MWSLDSDTSWAPLRDLGQVPAPRRAYLYNGYSVPYAPGLVQEFNARRGGRTWPDSGEKDQQQRPISEVSGNGRAELLTVNSDTSSFLSEKA